MSDHDIQFNIEAYQIMAEILVTVRRIVHRGLEKAAGKTWYLDGCPTGVYERLVARKENEVAIDRFDREYQPRPPSPGGRTPPPRWVESTRAWIDPGLCHGAAVAQSTHDFRLGFEQPIPAVERE